MECLLSETMKCRSYLYYWSTYNRRYKDNEKIMENIHTISIEIAQFYTRGTLSRG